MDFITFTAVYLAFTALLVFVMLFGESPIFIGTPVAKAHWLVTQGICTGGEWVISKFCGARGEKAVDAACEFCCERSNPTLQIAYMLIVATGYYLCWSSLFTRLPTTNHGEEHMFIATGLVCVSLTFFAAASMSDPGTVTTDNVAAHTALYPYDQAIWPNKECWTCKFDRPARSKHCRVCARCVPRFDHHCGWINNCVGLMNTRLFLGFLLSNIIMCIYGVCLAIAIVVDVMERDGMFYYVVTDSSTGLRVPLFKSPSRMLEFVVIYFPIPSIVTLFLIVATLLLFAFLGYQVQLILTGRTTYESFRWREYHLQLMEDAEKEAEKQAGSSERGKQKRRGGWGVLKWLGLQRKSAAAAAVVLPPNIYHRGCWHNMWEVLFPGRALQAASKRAIKTD